MDSANTPAISENVDTMNISNNQECLKDSMNEPKQTVETLMSDVEAKLKAGELDEAVEIYASVMQLTIAKYEGEDLNPLLAETYARYGSLLLRVAIKNNDQNVLSSTNAATAGTAETTEALLQAAAGNKKRLIEFNGDEEDDEEESPEGQDQEDDQSGEPEAEGAEDDEDDFTIAWENLDVARLLFEKRIESCEDESEKLALNRALGYVYQDLGDLSLENENFADAISEYELALKCFGNPTTEVLRDLAGIYFNLALSMEFENRLTESKDMYTRAKQLLQQKESYLLSTAASEIDEKANEDEPIANPELTELKGLINEITLKIEDMDNNNQAAMNQELQNATNKAALAAAQNLNGAVNDLSGMIKKRKADPVEAAPVQKEVKVEEEQAVEASEVKVEEQAIEASEVNEIKEEN